MKTMQVVLLNFEYLHAAMISFIAYAEEKTAICSNNRTKSVKP